MSVSPDKYQNTFGIKPRKSPQRYDSPRVTVVKVTTPNDRQRIKDRKSIAVYPSQLENEANKSYRPTPTRNQVIYPS